jgi:hypothetical protein
MKWSSLSLLTILSMKFTLSDINVDTSACFQETLAW